MVKCQYEWSEGNQLVSCGKKMFGDEYVQVWNGGEFVSLCNSCAENPCVLFCALDGTGHFEWVPCPSCGEF
jgi:hypothetical protein